MKVVINSCFGGFGLSHEAVMRYAEIAGFTLYPYVDCISKKVYGDRATLDNPDIIVHYSKSKAKDGDSIPDEDYFYEGDLERNDPILVQVVEELGDKANGSFAELSVVEVPDDVEWEISYYDGLEHVAEKHRTRG